MPFRGFCFFLKCLKTCICASHQNGKKKKLPDHIYIYFPFERWYLFFKMLILTVSKRIPFQNSFLQLSFFFSAMFKILYQLLKSQYKKQKMPIYIYVHFPLKQRLRFKKILITLSKKFLSFLKLKMSLSDIAEFFFLSTKLKIHYFTVYARRKCDIGRKKA